MDKSSNINLSIAALQSRRRSRALTGMVTLLILTCVAVGLLLFDPSGAQENSGTIQSDPRPPVDTPLKKMPVRAQSNQPELDSAVMQLVEALSDDVVYGALAARVALELQDGGQISLENERKLSDALMQKLADLDRALRQAVMNNNLVLVVRLSNSSFFVNYGSSRMPSWGWLATPTLERYKPLSEVLRQAQAEGDEKEILKTLVSIQETTGFLGFQSRIRQLKSTLATEYEREITEEMLSSMGAGDYQRVIQLADRHSALVTRERELQDLARQAESALSQVRRDEFFSTALAQAQSDKWEAAVKTLGRIPSNLLDDDMNQLEKSGTQIIKARQSLLNLAANPARLTDSSVEAYARREIDSAQELAVLSASLREAISELRSVLDKAAETVTVNILSDNQATILIPKLGYVQPTSKKTLELQRARYKFTIRCKGQRDKFERLDLSKSASSDTVNIRLTCED